MYGHGNPTAVLPSAATGGTSGGPSGGGTFGLPAAAAGTAAGGAGAAGSGKSGSGPAPIAVGGGVRQGPTGPGAAAAAAAAVTVTVNGAGGAEGLVAGLNEDQSRDILREEIGGDSPRCSGVAEKQFSLFLWLPFCQRSCVSKAACKSLPFARTLNRGMCAQV